MCVFGGPGAGMLEGGSEAELIDQTTEILLDAYCLSKPPTSSFEFPVTFTSPKMLIRHPILDMLVDHDRISIWIENDQAGRSG